MFTFTPTFANAQENLQDVLQAKYDLATKYLSFLADLSVKLGVENDLIPVLLEEVENYIAARVEQAEAVWPRSCVINGTDLCYLYRDREVCLSDSKLAIPDTLAKFPEIVREIEDQVVLQIVESGGNRIGPWRGALYAKEQVLDPNPAIIYGIDFSDPHLGQLLKYFESQINWDLNGISNYFSPPRFERQELKLAEVYERIKHRDATS